jgi:protein-ribulosamine 3-kinase
MIPENTLNAILDKIALRIGHKPKFLSSFAVSGGDINRAFKIETSIGRFFVKMNDAGRFPAMFEKEALGLNLLAKAGTIKIPEEIAYGQSDQDSFLILEYIEPASGQKDFWENFGTALARLHRNSNDFFGLDHDNYIGSLQQCNTKHKDWLSFFIQERLEKQLKLAVDNFKLGRADIRSFEKLFKRANGIFPVEAPALLHGDLWSGNFMIGSKGEVCLVDPAVYFGHREVDIAMSKLFGGFPQKFYEYYTREFPLEKDWQKRMEIFQLYPLLVHVNLFGESYVSSVRGIMKRF